MKNRLAVAAILVTTCGCTRSATLDVEAAKRLIPKAASIPNAEFEPIVTAFEKDEVPRPDAIKSDTLSWMVFASRIGELSPDVAFDNEQPRAIELINAFWKSRKDGYASLIQAEYITDCTCTVNGDRATGTVSFAAERLYHGRVGLVARLIGGRWQIEEFQLPESGWETRRGSDGVWHKSQTGDRK